MSFGVHTSFDLSKTVLFSWALKYPHDPSSTFLRTNPDARLILAAHLSPLKTKSIFWLIKELSKVDMAKLKTRCVPYSNSESTRKCWHAWSSSLRSASSSSRMLFTSNSVDFIWIPCPPVLCCRNAEKSEIFLKQILHLCVIFTRGVAYFSARWYFKSAWEVVEKLGHWVQ